jgi:hypothetical protein
MVSERFLNEFHPPPVDGILPSRFTFPEPSSARSHKFPVGRLLMLLIGEFVAIYNEAFA